MLLLACLFVGIGLVTAQTQKVTGVVISEEDGQPVIGASVLVKGTQLGTITGVDGDFTLSNVPSSAKTLQITYIGMQAQDVAIKPNVKVIMKSDTEMLDEVMVIAYGTTKKESFTGSAEVIKSEKLKERPVANVTKALDGMVAGVQTTSGSGQPGSGSSVVVRGYGSINSSQSPLYVVDGVPMERGFANLNTNDIESVEVLKDASAAAINCSGLLELSQYVSEERAKKYYKAAEKMLQTLSSPAYTAEEGTNGGFILKHSVGNIPSGTEVDMPLTYADYYYVEALCRYKSLNDKP